MKVIIDRFEGKYAICEKEDRSFINIERSKIPNDAKEGDVLIIENDSVIIDEIETKKRHKEIEDLTKELWD